MSSINTYPTFKYRIPLSELKISQNCLGRGSYGQVYEGEWRNKKVAVKIYRNQAVESFQNELNRLSNIKHENIVQLFGSTSSHSQMKESYLIMELSDCSLGHLLHESKRPYELSHALYWVYQAAKGVAYLHDLKPKPLIHRDLKPDNLLLFNRGKTLKICDFGTAVLQRTNMTNNTGSVSYMAPEVFKSDNYDHRCDVYSWAIIFWEILARRTPYTHLESNSHAILFQIASSGLRPPVLKSCPELIWSLITKSWHDNPELRPDMKEVIQKMKRIIVIGHAGTSQHSTDRHRSTRNSQDTNTDDSDTWVRIENFAHLKGLEFKLKLIKKRHDELSTDSQSSSSNSDVNETDQLNIELALWRESFKGSPNIKSS